MLVAGFTSSLSGCRHWFFHRRVRYPQFSFSLLSPTYLGLYYPRVQLRCFCHQLGIRCVRICVWSRQRYDTLPPRKVGCVSRTNGQPIDGILWPLSGEGAYVWFGLFSAPCRLATIRRDRTNDHNGHARLGACWVRSRRKYRRRHRLLDIYRGHRCRRRPPSECCDHF